MTITIIEALPTTATYTGWFITYPLDAFMKSKSSLQKISQLITTMFIKMQDVSSEQILNFEIKNDLFSEIFITQVHIK